MLRNLTLTVVLLAVPVLLNGCVGLAHASHCSSDVPGKHYRATRVDMKVMAESPLAIPLVIALDLPFALVVETLEVPFIAFGGYDPRPPAIGVGFVPDPVAVETMDAVEADAPAP